MHGIMKGTERLKDIDNPLSEWWCCVVQDGPESQFFCENLWAVYYHAQLSVTLHVLCIFNKTKVPTLLNYYYLKSRIYMSRVSIHVDLFEIFLKHEVGRSTSKESSSSLLTSKFLTGDFHLHFWLAQCSLAFSHYSLCSGATRPPCFCCTFHSGTQSQ